MANVVLNNLQTVYINGKQVKKLFFQGKEIPLSVDISFDTNMTGYYYISGQGGTATTTAPPATMAVPRGMPIGTLPSFGNYTYTLSGVTYTIYVVGWYLESSLTTQVTTSWVPTQDTTLYAKWKMTANVNISAAVTIPKFAASVSWSCSSNGGNRTAVSRKTTGYYVVALAMTAPGAGKNSDSYTWTGVGGKAITALSSQSMTLNGITRTVSTPGASAVASGQVNVNNAQQAAVSTTVFNTSSLKVIVARPKLSDSNTTVTWTASFYYGSTLLKTVDIAKVNYRWSTEQDLHSFNAISDTYSARTYTWGGSNGGASGAYGVSKAYTTGSGGNTVSLAAASGSGYSRSITVNA